MARILFAIPRFHTNLWFAVRALTGAGHDVRFLVNLAGKGEDHSHATPVVMGRYPTRTEVTAQIRDFAPDLVIVRNAWALSRRAARAARQAGVPCLLYNQEPLNQPTSLLRRIELAWKGLPPRRLTPVRGLGGGAPDPFATDLPWPVAALPAPDVTKDLEKVQLLCVGKLGLGRKNQPLLIRAINEAGLQDHVHLTLIGSAPKPKKGQAEHGAFLTQLAEAPWITLLQQAPFQDMPQHYSRSDICILPSRDEPLGTSPIEAMAYGAVPVISAECGSAGYLRDGVDGFVVNVRDTTDLADRLTRLVEDADLRARMGQAARATVQDDLSEARFLERFDALLGRSTR